MRSMDAVSAILIVLFQVFFGWCGEEADPSPPPAPTEASAAR
jgi:hypothetical protein